MAPAALGRRRCVRPDMGFGESGGGLQEAVRLLGVWEKLEWKSIDVHVK